VRKTATPSLAQWLETPVGPKRRRSFRVRLLIQAAFAATCLVIGFQLSRFYLAARAGELPLPRRPPGVEGFLPISGLMGILDWAYQGALNRIHPAATIVVILALLSAFLLRKSFCSWVCPVGFISEGLARLGRRLFGRNFQVWSWLDRTLQSLKYLLLGFFIWAIVSMSAEALQAFIHSPYNKVADVKMGLFFVSLGQVGITVMVLLVVGSVFIQGLWCRYLCPYGALLGLFSWMSPVRIRRTADRCVDCSLCDQACMARLPISQLAVVRSVECTGCVDCLAVCPVQSTLELAAGPKRLGVSTYAAAVILLFQLGTVAARMTGVWHNDITEQEYVQRFQEMERPEYGHPGADQPSDREDP
jgi:ferredoxin